MELRQRTRPKEKSIPWKRFTVAVSTIAALTFLSGNCIATQKQNSKEQQQIKAAAIDTSPVVSAETFLLKNRKLLRFTVLTQDTWNSFTAYADGKSVGELNFSSAVKNAFGGKFVNRRIFVSSTPTVLIEGTENKGKLAFCLFRGQLDLIDEIVVFSSIFDYAKLKALGIEMQVSFDWNKKSWVIEAVKGDLAYYRIILGEDKTLNETDYGLLSLLDLKGETSALEVRNPAKEKKKEGSVLELILESLRGILSIFK